MDRIVLTSSPYSATDAGASDFAVVANGYAAPSRIPIVTLESLLSDMSWTSRSATMVVVGLSKMLTPSNRTKVGQALLRPWPGIRRVSVDGVLFVSDPWRAWWHFYAVGEERWGYTDSFTAESKWRMALEREELCPFRKDALVDACRGVVRGVDPFRFGPVDVVVKRVGSAARREYSRIKEKAFRDEKTVAAIIGRLASFAQEAEPSRDVPTCAAIFRSAAVRVVRTNLAVDEFLVGRILERVETTNAVAEASVS